jgi:L-lactate dehydrogenase complex protein LldG
VSEARDVVLRRIRDALRDVPASERLPVDRRYRRRGHARRSVLVERLAERVREYGGVVIVTDEPAAVIAAVVRGRSVVCPPDLPADLRAPDVDLVEDAGLMAGVLDKLDGALTTCAAACSDTGSIALDGGPGQGRRAITLVPDLHVCVVRSAQIVETVPELFVRLEPSAREGRPIVIVSGPSATSDIELNRVEGVHGPRRFVLVIDVSKRARRAGAGASLT